MIRYRSASGEDWSCLEPDRLRADIGVTEPELNAFHVMVEANDSAWRVARLLYGLQPVLPGAEYPLEYLTTYTPEKLAAHLGTNRAGITAEINAIRGIWKAVLDRRKKRFDESRLDKSAKLVRKEEVFGAESQASMDLNGEAGVKLLRDYGFEDVEFHGNEAERRWFIARIEDMRKMLDDSMASDLSRRIILNDLQRRRLSIAIANVKPTAMTGIEYNRLLGAAKKLDDTHMAQLTALDEIAPWKGLTGNKVGLRGSLSDFTRAMQMFRGRRDASMATAIAKNTEVEIVADRGMVELLGHRLLDVHSRLVDGVFTADEIEVLMRTCEEAPVPQYRPEIIVFINRAREGLWDPDFKPALPEDVLLRLKKGWDGAEEAVRKASGVKVVNIASEKPGDEYPALMLEQIEEERASKPVDNPSG